MHRYAPALKLQKGYEETYKSPGKYYISGGTQKTKKELKEKYKNCLNGTDFPEDDATTVNLYKLGMVGTMNE